jgi:putative transposase
LVDPTTFSGEAMATTFTRILIHFIFSTKNREPLISPDIEPKLHAYMRGICKNLESPVLAMNGTADHVHMLVSMSKKIAITDLMETVKKESSIWIKKQDREFAEFYWQEGYAGLSIGESAIEQVTKYITKQKEHHRRVCFFLDFWLFLFKNK